jgi:aminoglycoside phosphotransferase
VPPVAVPPVAVGAGGPLIRLDHPAALVRWSLAVDFRRRRPSPETLTWVGRETGGKVVAWRRMTGGIVTTVHRLTVERGAARSQLILRQFERATASHVRLIEDEAAVLQGVAACGLAAPEFVAACPDGAKTSGYPSLLMTRLPGHIDLRPADRGQWLQQIAGLAVRIHNAPVAAPAFRSWIDPADLKVPASASRPRLWQTVISVLQQPGSMPDPCFIHGDFQHFNFLWRRDRLTGVVDWGLASTGPPDVDAGHCRLNLAVLFGADVAEQFRLVYEAEAGAVVDPWWDLQAIGLYGDSWPQFIPVQVAGRVPVDARGMTARVEDLLQAVLRRL